MSNDFLQLNDNITKDNIFDDVEIIIDPDLEDESTVDINNYLNNFILQCRVCGNLFPSKEMLDDDHECPICGFTSSNGFIFKGKLKQKNNKNDNLDTINNIDGLVNSDNNDSIK